MKRETKFNFQRRTGILKYLLVGMLMISTSFFAQTQSKTISGYVHDEKGMGLPGVTVTVKGTKTGITSDFDGNYKIQATAKDQLVFSFVGFNSKTITVGERTTININLESSTSNLDEIIVVGYGTRKRGDLTGSVSKASMGDIQKAPVRSFDEALAGRVAGVQVTSSDGQPGSGVDIVIRGNNSVTQDNSPLYVVDGFILENPNNNAINPKDIESLEVLKDASATAIYGARGANGVIVITTKKGKKGQAVFNFDSSYGFQKMIDTRDLMSSYDFVKLQLELDPTPTSGGAYKTPTELYLTDPGKTLEDYRNVPAVDWQRKVTEVAPMQNYNLSVSGGNDNTRYIVTGSYLGQDGVIINSGYKRYQGRIAIDQNIGKKVKVGFNMNYSNLQQSGISPAQSSFSATNNIMYSVWGYRPFSTNTNVDYEEEVIDPDINPANDYRTNPVINLNNLYRLNTTQNFYSNAYLDYDILPGLKLRVTNGVTENRVQNEAFNNSKTQYGRGSTGVNGSINNSQFSNWLNENTLTWKHQFAKKHNLDLMGGMTFQKQTSKSYGVSAINLPNEDLGLAGLYQGTPQRVDTFESLWSMASFLARADYNYDSRYYLTVTMRADGSSKFPVENHWAYFPSGAAMWRFKNEKFLKNNSILSEGKLKFSYGETGNNRVGDFDYVTTYYNPVGYAYAFNNQYVDGIAAQNLGNSKLKWETTAQTDLGLDLGFFNQRISLTTEVYRKKTTDLLLKADLPTSSGFASAMKNVGAMQNEGLEFTLNTQNIVSPSFTWSSSFNISFNKNEVTQLADGQDNLQSVIRWDSGWQTIPAYIAKIGDPIGLMYGYISEGTYKYSDFNQDANGQYTILKPEVATNGNARANIRPGDSKYKDINGDGVVNASDYTVIGHGLPKHTGGFTNNFTYKGFDLNIFFQWSYGNDILNANRAMFQEAGPNALNKFAAYNDRWSPDNTDSDMPRARGYFGGGYSSQWVEDGSYIRLKTVSFGYNFDNKLISKLHLKSLRLYVSGQNLATWTKYTGPDPEVSTYRSALTTGFDYSAYPRARTITTGLNVTF